MSTRCGASPATLRGRIAYLSLSLRGAQRTKQSRPAELRLHEIVFPPGTARLGSPPSGGRNDSGFTGQPAMPNAA